MKSNNVTFTVQCTMPKRWKPHFLAMLQQMQHLGNIGSSRYVTLFADGDGDFRPKFKLVENIFSISRKKNLIPNPPSPVNNSDGNITYDAG